MEINRLEPCIPVPLEPKVLEEIVSKSKDYALMHGAGIRPKVGYNPDGMIFAPFALLPSAFPRSEFERAVTLQPVINELMHKVAHCHDFLSENLRSTLEVDEFTAKLFEIYETVRHEGIAQKLSLGLIRADLMLESRCANTNSFSAYCCWKQVEVNTIASGFGWLGPISSGIHRYVLSELGHSDKIKNLPENNALQGLCQGILDAWEMYGAPRASVLFVVEPITYNICDQRFMEFQISDMNPNVKVIRRTFSQLGEEAKLEGAQKKLFLGDSEVAVVYYRTGYSPNDYSSPGDWDVRLLIERSSAIKCPSIQYHLAGTKKIQQILAGVGVLERFLPSTDKSSPVKKIFTGLYSLDSGETGERNIQMALADPERYVMKPQREGGNNNIYGQDIVQVIRSAKNHSELSAYILMDRIFPPVLQNYIVRAGQDRTALDLDDTVSELGVFGVVIGDENSIVSNKQVGHMLRSKLVTTNEGGVASGYGVLDSPYLF